MQMLIDGRWVDARDGKTRSIRNPGNGETIDTVPMATLRDVDAALEAAVAGSARMRATPAHARSAILARAADIIGSRKEELATLLARENGKPIRQTRDEIEVASRIFRGFAEEARRLFGRTVPMDAIPGQERHFAMTIRQPLGVVAAIVPFNYPAELYAHKAAPALAAGNAVIAKPPSDCPLRGDSGAIDPHHQTRQCAGCLFLAARDSGRSEAKPVGARDGRLTRTRGAGQAFHRLGQMRL